MRLIGFLVALILMAVLLTGCGADTTPASAPADTPATPIAAATSSTTVAPAPDTHQSPRSPRPPTLQRPPQPRRLLRLRRLPPRSQHPACSPSPSPTATATMSPSTRHPNASSPSIAPPWKSFMLWESRAALPAPTPSSTTHQKRRTSPEWATLSTWTSSRWWPKTPTSSISSSTGSYPNWRDLG